jgi:hypothetical protein
MVLRRHISVEKTDYTFTIVKHMETNKVKNLAKDLSRDFPRSPREMLVGYVIAGRTLDKCRATIVGTNGEYHFDCPLDNFFFSFAEISGNEFKDFVASGATDDEVAKWIEQKAKPRPRIEIIKWNNDLRYKRLSEMPDHIQEFMAGSRNQTVRLVGGQPQLESLPNAGTQHKLELRCPPAPTKGVTPMSLFQNLAQPGPYPGKNLDRPDGRYLWLSLDGRSRKKADENDR